MASEFEISVMEQLGQIQAATAATATGVADLRRELLDPGGRVPQIEAKMKTTDNRQWLTIMVIGPATMALHALLRRIGVQI